MAMHTRHLARRNNPLLGIKLPAFRSHLVMLLIALAFVSLAARAAYLQVFTHTYLQKQGGKRYERSVDLPASRGKIVDRNGQVLASSVPAHAIWAIPDQVDASPEKLRELAKLLGVPERELARKLADEDRTFVYLKRQVEDEAASKIAALNISGIHRRNEYKRIYPEGETLAHVVGFTNVEDVGQEGVELGQQKLLGGRPGMRRVIKDGRGHIVDDLQAIREPMDGRDLSLSVDTKIQFLAHSALRAAVRDHRAKAGAAVVLDVQTGEVLALSNWPTYNPNERGQLSGAQLRNRVITDTFEPGSTMKPFTVALALELGKVRPKTVIQTAPGKLTIGPDTIGDAHMHGPLTVEEVIQKSSNVGTAKMALSMNAREMWDMYVALGFGQAPELGFPGAVAGKVRPHKKWKPIEQATMSYGHGLSVSLMQLARAYMVFARDGEMAPLTLFKPDHPATGTAVIKPETARAVRKMLEMAAGPDGTAPKAQIAGYRVAGKTGTSHKQENGRYVKKYVASFVGFAPASNPRVIVAVMVDEPSNGKHYSGDVAAPLFAKITGDALRALHVAPDAPLANLVMPIRGVAESF
jgi:cell division protein FtsI (penicillin-binding protein 3)